MRIRVPGLPFVFDVNGYMAAGMVVFTLGVGGYVAGEFGAFPPESPLSNVFFGLAMAGMALYFLGRIVQFIAMVRRREP